MKKILPILVVSTLLALPAMAMASGKVLTISGDDSGSFSDNALKAGKFADVYSLPLAGGTGDFIITLPGSTFGVSGFTEALYEGTKLIKPTEVTSLPGFKGAVAYDYDYASLGSGLYSLDLSGTFKSSKSFYSGYYTITPCCA